MSVSTPPESPLRRSPRSGSRCSCPAFGCGERGPGAATFDVIFSDIELYGRLLGSEDRAAASVAELRRRVAVVERRIPGESDATVMAGGIFEEEIFVWGSASVANTLIETLGFTNAFADVQEDVTTPSREEIIARDPDAVVLFSFQEAPEDTEADFLAIPETAALTAVQEGNVIVIPAAYYQGNQLAVTGLEILAERLARLR
ncbi:MAG: ABC transporter substrate-binding protein [Egibacteraceae bacterium]